MPWMTYAAISAVAAGLTAVLAKVGVEGVPSNLATAIRTVVVLLFAWAIALGAGEHRVLGTLSRRSVIFLVLSALATGVSWLAYYRALQLAPASRVAPIDKLSLPLTLIFAAIFLGEAMTWRLVVGVALMTVGALFTLK
jgi:bacterial/archaeal transporter family protein